MATNTLIDYLNIFYLTIFNDVFIVPFIYLDFFTDSRNLLQKVLKYVWQNFKCGLKVSTL